MLPPEAETVAWPLAVPKQVCAVVLTTAIARPFGEVMVAFTVVMHPFASLIVQVYVPALAPLRVAEFWTGEEFQLKV